MAASTRMRIGLNTLVASPLRPGSIFEYTQLLVESLAEHDRENEWYIFVSEANRGMFSKVSSPRFTFVLCGASNEHRYRRILSEQLLLPYKASRLGLDVIYFLGDVCPFVRVCPYVIKLNTFHHFREPKAIGRVRAIYRRFAGNSSAGKATRLIANSQSAKDDAISFVGLSAEKIAIIDEAIDHRFQPVDTGQTGFPVELEKLGVSANYVLFVSLLYRHKNVARLISAFSEVIRSTGSSHVLVVAGQDVENLRPEFVALATQLGIKERVVFLGRVSFADLVGLYQWADVFVYPSLSETFGKPPLEAMACGCPVVASAVGSIPEVVGDAALLCDPENDADIANKITMILTDPALAKTQVAKGYARVGHFSWSRVATETVDVLEAAAAQNSKSREDIIPKS